MFPSNQSHATTCRCAVCRMVESNRNRRVFVGEANQLIGILPGQRVDKYEIFAQPGRMPSNGSQPTGSLMLSHGSHLAFSRADHLHTKSSNGMRSMMVIATDQPVNILRINKFEEFQWFVSRYGSMMPDHQTVQRKHQITHMKEALSGICRAQVDANVREYFTRHNISYDAVVDISRERCGSAYSEREIAEGLAQRCPDIAALLGQPDMIDPLVVLLSRLQPLRYFYAFQQLDHMDRIADTLVPDPVNINWAKIQDDGYYGVYFGFRKIAHIVPPGITVDLNNFAWHELLGTEILFVFDLRALQNVRAELLEWEDEAPIYTE